VSAWGHAGSKHHDSGKGGWAVPFTYNADWTSPGRWALTLHTRKKQIILQPMEDLQVMESGSFLVKKLPLQNYDVKCGIVEQAFSEM